MSHSPIRRIRRVLWGGIYFPYLWTKTRQWRLLLGAIPAFVLALPLGVVAFCIPFYTRSDKANYYLRTAHEAVMEKDFPTAELCYQKLFQMGAADNQLRFEWAAVAAEAKRMDEAYLRIQQVAPVDRAVYAPAHLWLAKAHMNRLFDLPESQIIPHMEVQLKHVLTLEPRHEEANRLLAYVYQQTGRYEDAIPLVRQLVVQTPVLRLVLAELYQLVGNAEMSRNEANALQDYFVGLIRSGQELSSEAYQQWIQVLTVSKQFREAEQIGLRALEKHPDDRNVRRAFAKTYIDWGEEHGRIYPSDLEGRLQLLDRAVRLAPDDPELLAQLARLTRFEGEQAKQAQELLERLLVNAKAPLMVHLVLGTIAGSNGDMEKAEQHLEQALLIDPQMPVVLNNLAWLLAHQEPPNLDRALELIDRARKYDPAASYIMDTRGQILHLMGRHKEAIASMEQALAGLSNQEKVETHRVLAKCYRAIGDEKLAQRHDDAAKDLAELLKSQETAAVVGGRDS